MKALVLSLFLVSTSTFARNDKYNGWFGTFTKKKLTERFSFWAETQLRYNFDFGETNQILYRTGILHKLNKTHELGYLYAYIQGGTLKEHRFTLQHSMKYGNFKGFSLSHRARLEARTYEDSDDTEGRFRYLARAQENTSKKMKMVGWNEVFINLTNDQINGDRVFDRNRLFLGLRRTYEDMNLEFGYLNQYIPKTNGEDTMEHILTIYLFF